VKYIGLLLYITVVFLVFFYGKFILVECDKMVYSIISFYIVLPLTALLSSALIDIRKKEMMLITAIIIGIVNNFVPYFVFSTKNCYVFKIEWVIILFGFLMSLIGFEIGQKIRAFKESKNYYK
jgi:uncharacterized membrane protein YeaQ/YmgE (transglycosylase-associated protein family)